MPEGFKWHRPEGAVTLGWNPWCYSRGAAEDIERYVTPVLTLLL